MTSPTSCPCGCRDADRPALPKGYNPGGWAPADAWAFHHLAWTERLERDCKAFLDHCSSLLTASYGDRRPYASPVQPDARLPEGAIAGVMCTWRSSAELPVNRGVSHTLRVRVHWRIHVLEDRSVILRYGVGALHSGDAYLHAADDLSSRANVWIAGSTAIGDMLKAAAHTHSFIVEHAAKQRGLTVRQ